MSRIVDWLCVLSGALVFTVVVCVFVLKENNNFHLGVYENSYPSGLKWPRNEGNNLCFEALFSSFQNTDGTMKAKASKGHILS